MDRAGILTRQRSTRARMGARQLLQSFDAWRATAEPLVLATVYETAGSTYSKAGHRILLAANGDYRGLVSGGCLEGDLAERSRGVTASGRPAAGYLRLAAMRRTSSGARRRLQRLAARVLAAAVRGQRLPAISPRLPSASRGTRAGRRRNRRRERARRRAGGCDGRRATRPASGCSESAMPALRRCAAPAATRCTARRHGSRRRTVAEFSSPRCSRFRGCSCSAAASTPFLSSAWRPSSVGSSRSPIIGPGYLARGGFERAERAVLVEPGRVAAALPLGGFAAIVVMSHHLATDRKYLAELASVGSRYLGVLGPARGATGCSASSPT